jgi:hypothetical protein
MQHTMVGDEQLDVFRCIHVPASLALLLSGDSCIDATSTSRYSMPVEGSPIGPSVGPSLMERLSLKGPVVAPIVLSLSVVLAALFSGSFSIVL